MLNRENAPYLILSLLINMGFLGGILFITSTSGCTSEAKTEEPMEFTVVTEENAADRLAEEPNEATDPEPTPEPPKETQPQTQTEKPQNLPPPPPPVDNTPPPPPPPKTPEKPKDKPKDPPKKPDKPKETPPQKNTPKPTEKTKPKPIKIGQRVGPITTGKKEATKPPTQQAMRPEDIRRQLAAGAKAGNKNQIPSSEDARCKGIVISRFQEACRNYGLEPSHRKLVLEFHLDAQGRVSQLQIKESSGDRAWDDAVLQACRTVRTIEGLSRTWIENNKINTINLRVR